LKALPLIESKRNGDKLGESQIHDLVAACVTGQIPDYQLAAFLMAVYFRGLDDEETAALTLAMRDSGDVLEFPEDERPVVDKHSTGGIGDKVSLPLAPLLACLGFRVPMISGRGLGITGGTLDKLDSIPGFNTLLPADRIIDVVQTVGCVICGQTERMVPADKKLYALRDVTGTVPSIPLIVASILSKKLAEGLSALILDVKFGAAAFMPTRAKARELATAMVALGNRCGVNTRALLTPMDAPLGRSAGNWLEIRESVACLDSQPGSDPAPDLRALVIECAAQLLVQTGRTRSLRAARKQASDCLSSGKPRRRWDEMLSAQGADLQAFREKLEQDSTASTAVELTADRAGHVTRADARLIGEIIRDLGGGRLTRDSRLNYDVGMDRLAKPGDAVQCGSVLARVHAADAAQAEAALSRLRPAFEISEHAPAAAKLVAAIVS
jgi:pyrimidine-nucleoside phosphorylase